MQLDYDLATELANIKFPVTATYDKQPEAADFANLTIVKAAVYGLSTGNPTKIISDPGVGKTSFITQLCQSLGLDVVYLPAATMSPEELAVPMPALVDGKMQLDYLMFEPLARDRPKVILIDEPSRSNKATLNQLMELVQEKSLAGHPVPNIVGIFACDNEGTENGITLHDDAAQADRWTTIKIGPNDTPWRRALASKFSSTDLTRVYEVYKTLTPRLRYLLSPRTLEHVIYNGLAGNPLEWGLPLHSGNRALLITDEGADRTDEVLGKIASALGASNPARLADPVEKAVTTAIRDGVNLLIEGPPGIGKTAYVTSKVKALGYEAVYLSAPVVTPDDLAVPFPMDGKLDIMIMRRLMTPTPKVIIIDEIWRCSAHAKSKFMELTQEGSIGGVKIPGLVCVIAMTNPKKMPLPGGKFMTFDVGVPDRAQADRFFMSIQVQADDVPAMEYLLQTYGDIAEPFVEWWKNDIDDLGRILITKRSLVRMIALHQAGFSLEWGKTYVNSEYVQVSLHDLEARLAKRIPAHLRAIAAKIDQYVAWLEEGDSRAPRRTRRSTSRCSPRCRRRR